MKMLNPAMAVDFYKTAHWQQYPKGTTMVYSNMTPRGSRIPGIDKVVFFGLQYFIKEYLIRQWEEEFFCKPLKTVLDRYKRRIDGALGKDCMTLDHIKGLHSLGALPVQIKAMREGSLVDMRVPVLTIQSTMNDYFWVTNYLETLMSCTIWSASTSATLAHNFKLLLNKYADETIGNRNFVPFQAHDFSMRDMSSLESACLSGAGHLISFYGTDTVPALDFIEEYYGFDGDGILGCSVPATEHATMCAGTKEKELDTYKNLLKIYPKGVVSIVSDTWDYWNVLTKFLPQLKDEILKRDGKVVIRPDSGDPVKIVCGDESAPEGSPERMGSIEILAKLFGVTKNKQGYKELNPKIGLIYGDSITLERATAILEGLKKKRFASNNIVFGVGSYTYQYNTRDTFGFAHKATMCIVNGSYRPLFKDTKTDDGTKKSARGWLSVLQKNDDITKGYKLQESIECQQNDFDVLQTVFSNGQLAYQYSFNEVRKTLEKHY